jgi:hypothetical protein
VPVKVYPYLSEYGKRGGLIRNRQMIDEWKPDAVVAFPGGRGTAHCVTRAKSQGIPVWEVGSNLPLTHNDALKV